MDVTVAFPGLGIESFDINRAINPDGAFKIYWYGIIITLGIIFAFAYTTFRGKYEKVVFDDIVTIALWTVILGVVGARLYYVLTSLEKFVPVPFNFIEFIKEVVNIRDGGLAIYGGIIGGALGVIISTRIVKINTLKFMDAVAPGVMLAQTMGRWGNFCNGEAYGAMIEEGNPLYFIRMGLISNNTHRDFGTWDMVYVHPTFLYESLWNLLGFVLLNVFYKKKKFNGQIVSMYFAWYGFGRMFIEGLRTDSLYVGPFRISQVVGLLCFVVFGSVIIAGLIYTNKQKVKVSLTAFDEYIIPDIVEHPVFFEKKQKTSVSENKEEKPTEQPKETEKEENDNGENN